MPLNKRLPALRALESSEYCFYLIARFLVLVTYMILAIVIGQYIYQITKNPLYLGYVGLFLFIPKISFVLFAGSVADRYDRALIIKCCRLLQVLVACGFLILVVDPYPKLGGFYTLLFLMGVANAFDGPASQSLLPQLIREEHLSNAVTLNSSMMQLGFIFGPMLGGFLYAINDRPLESVVVVLLLRVMSFVLVLKIKPKPHLTTIKGEGWRGLLRGVAYVYEKKLILGVISLDLFAVLLGGATALMPVFANDILHVGPKGLGVLRAAMPVGALLMGWLIASHKNIKNAGKLMLFCVGLFGAFTIVFGLSQNFYLSLLCLLIMGAADMVSVVIRGVIIQTHTPIDMRGRVSAVNLVFIGASNELGEFESGITASWWGTRAATLVGGVGTLVIVGLYSFLFPEVRRFKNLVSEVENK